jgi:hypothetical protein
LFLRADLIPATTAPMFPRAFSRKSFLKLAALALGSISLPLAFFRLPSPSNKSVATPTSRCIRIVPLEGHTYSASFLAFCEQARFESISHALHSVRDQELEFSLEYCDT